MSTAPRHAATQTKELRNDLVREGVVMAKKPKTNGRVRKSKPRSKKNNDYWRRKTFEEIAAEQGVDPTKTLENLLGKGADWWASDEEFEEFLAILRKAKTQGRN
jgi:hypothetical protein